MRLEMESNGVVWLFSQTGYFLEDCTEEIYAIEPPRKI